jgi:hypothetical protein
MYAVPAMPPPLTLSSVLSVPRAAAVARPVSPRGGHRSRPNATGLGGHPVCRVASAAPLGSHVGWGGRVRSLSGLLTIRILTHMRKPTCCLRAHPSSSGAAKCQHGPLHHQPAPWAAHSSRHLGVGGCRLLCLGRVGRLGVVHAFARLIRSFIHSNMKGWGIHPSSGAAKCPHG